MISHLSRNQDIYLLRWELVFFLWPQQYLEIMCDLCDLLVGESESDFLSHYTNYEGLRELMSHEIAQLNRDISWCSDDQKLMVLQNPGKEGFIDDLIRSHSDFSVQDIKCLCKWSMHTVLLSDALIMRDACYFALFFFLVLMLSARLWSWFVWFYGVL